MVERTNLEQKPQLSEAQGDDPLHGVDAANEGYTLHQSVRLTLASESRLPEIVPASQVGNKDLSAKTPITSDSVTVFEIDIRQMLRSDDDGFIDRSIQSASKVDEPSDK